MQTMVFSKDGIHYRDEGSGTVKAIFVPATTQKQKLMDLTSVNDATIRQRCEGINGKPLYRKEGEAIQVVGELPEELLEKRQGVEVHLPQDFAPKNASVFYFIFGKDYVIHGVKKRLDNGEVVWGTSLLDVRKKELNKVIISSISDRMLVGEEETICVAVHGSDAVMEDMQNALTTFDITVDKFSSLSVPKYIPTVYAHKDYSLVMLTMIIFTFLVMGGTTAYFVRNTVKLNTIDEEITELESEIKKLQDNRKLGYIKDPRKILDLMEDPMAQQPSAIIHAIGSSVRSLGTLADLSFKTLDNPVKKQGQIVADITLRDVSSELLVDQERIARSILPSRPWIRKIERADSSSRGGSTGKLPLKIWVQVE